MPRYWIPLALLLAAVGLPDAHAGELIQLEKNVVRTTLDNGLDVVVVTDRSLPLVTIEIGVRNGAFTEPPEYDGLSHLYEHMFFKGNQAIPNQEAYMARQRELGMQWNGTTSTERVNYFFTMTSDKWREGMMFMGDAIRTPLFDQKELAKERIVVLDEISRNESSPYFHLHKAVDKEMWTAHPSRKDVLGSRHIIETVTREKMLTMQRRYYIPNNSVLLVAGDVDVEAVVREAEQVFGDWESGDDPFVSHPLPEHPPLVRSSAVIVEQPVQRVTVTISWHGPDTTRDSEATYAADVFSFILDQQGSEFYRELVESGITLGASISYFTQKNVGPITLSFSTTPDKLEAACRAVSSQLDRFDEDDYFEDEQIDIAKTLLEVSDIYGREQTSSWTHTLSFWWSSAGLEYYLGYVDNLKQVQRDGMTRYVQQYIQSKPFVVGVLMSPETHQKLGVDEATILNWLGGNE